MKARKLSSGNYRVQLYVGKDGNGKLIRKSFTAPSAWEAMQMAEEYRELRGIGVAENRLTVRMAINEYIEVRTNLLAPSTLRSYRLIRDTRLQSVMGIPIRSLKILDVQSAVNADAVTLSRKSVHEAVSLLNGALRSHGIDLMLNRRITLPRARKTERSLPPLGEVISAIKGTSIELPCLLAMWLSLRISEVRGLRFSDIDPAERTITVRRSVVYFDGEDHHDDFNKTLESTRTIPLPPYLFDMISALPRDSDEDHIVQAGYNGIYKRFKKIMKERGFDMRFHDLRHEFASALSELNIPEKYIQKLGGWSSPHTLKSVYIHTLTPSEQAYQQQINALFEGMIGEK